MSGSGSDIDTGLLEASRLVEEGEAEGALQLLLTLEPDHSTDATLLCMIGVVADHLGARGVAVDFFRRCLAEQPTDPALLVRAGSGLAAAGDPEAEPALRLAALTAPDLAPARLSYGSFLVRSGLLNEGFEELRVARSLDPDSAEVRREMAVGYLLTGNETEAANELEVAVELDPDDSETRFLRGLVLVQRGETALAAEELHPGAAALEDDGEAQLVLALVFALEDWLDEAWLALSRAEAAAAPADPELVREIEEALEAGEEEARSLLLLELASSALRARIHTE